MQTSGVVLDLFDESRGRLLRDVFPTYEALPELVKMAHYLTPEEREKLPDDLYALVLVNGDQKLRKYACIDGGNTMLSVIYFVKNAHKLPEQAQKVAAAKLIEACGWYGLDVPEELEKIAFLGKAMTALTALPVVTGTASSIKSNLGAAKQLGGHIATPKQLGELGMAAKLAETSGTDCLPHQPSATRVKSKTVIQKSAQSSSLASDAGTPGKQPERNPQARPLSNVVDVSAEEAPRTGGEKKASRYALGDRYPLDSYAQVKAAAAYFDRYSTHFAPGERRQFAIELVKRASELAIPVSTRVQKYGSFEFAPTEEIKVAHDARRLVLEDEHQRAVLDVLFEKRASIDPDTFCEALSIFDREAGVDHVYDHAVPDPYFSTYGTKIAEHDEEFSEHIGNDHVTEKDLRRLAREGGIRLKVTFNQDFLEEFQKDPVSIFKSMPRDQKIILMRMATDTAPAA